MRLSVVAGEKSEKIKSVETQNGHTSKSRLRVGGVALTALALLILQVQRREVRGVNSS